MTDWKVKYWLWASRGEECCAQEVILKIKERIEMKTEQQEQKKAVYIVARDKIQLTVGICYHTKIGT